MLEQLRPFVVESLDPLVITAPTGSGKSSRVPLWLQTKEERVLVVEPRRVACRSLARYMASLCDSSLGARVGYAVRFEQSCSAQTRVLLVTPGVALAMCLGEDPDIRRYSSVVLDEFHERGLETDLLLALLPRVHPQGRVVVMSATLDSPRLVAHLGATSLKAEGRQYPVEVDYLPEVLLPSRDQLSERVLKATQRALQATAGHVLVFLPGMREINDCAQRLNRLAVEVIPLHGSLPPEQQDLAFQETSRRRVVLATNVAETSVTLPGITAVVDSGLARQAIHRSGHSTLTLLPISQASAEQRRGRAGRLQAGICLRLWSREALLETSSAPEIQRRELTSVALWAAAAGSPLPTLRFLDPPPAFAVERAQERLRAWEAVTAEGQITESGRQLSALPLPPELARLLQAAPDELAADVADLCAVLEARSSILARLDRLSAEEALAVREARERELPGSEPIQAIAALRRGQLERHRLHPESLREARQTARQLRELRGCPPGGPDKIAVEALTRYLLRTWPERAYVRRARREAFGNGVDEVVLASGSRLDDKVPAALMLVIEPVAATRGLRTELRARHPLPCSLRMLEEAGLGESRVEQPVLEGERVLAEVARCYAGRELSRGRSEPAGALLRQALAELVMRGRLFKPVRDLLPSALERRALQRVLEGQEARLQTPHAWLEERLERLGVREQGDHLMLETSDLLPDPLPVEVEKHLDALYPATFRPGTARYRVEYRPAERLVTLHWEGGLKNVVVNAGQLPRWNGWAVWLDERGRRTLLR